jgi:phytanoyl-CoA hydroxylase
MDIAQADIDRFHEDGMAVFDNLLSQQAVDRTLAAMERVYRGEYNEDRRPPQLRKRLSPLGSAGSVQWILNARVLDRDLWEMACDAQLGERAARLLATSSVSIVEDQLLAKPPNGLPVNVHQDYSYWPFSRSEQMVSCWIALVDVTLEMGPIQILKGSHRWGASTRPKVLIDGSEKDWLDGIKEVVPPGQKVELATVQVRAGGGVFFHSLCFHGSARNRSTEWRRAISLHWAGSACRVNMAKTANHDFPYFFARLRDGGPLVNNYMPVVYPPAPSEGVNE